jgi:UDPglucose 6-dehydrogenase
MTAVRSAISIVGIGRLGICFAAVFAERQHHVIGVDIRKERVKEVNEGGIKTTEPFLAEYLKYLKGTGDLEATTDYGYAVTNTDITFIVVNTPSRADGGFSNEQVDSVLKGMSPALREKEGHLVVVASTVMPGSMRAFSRLLDMPHVGLCYNPSFIAQGNVIRGIQGPDLVLIGEPDFRSGGLLQDLWSEILRVRVPIVRMSWENAELTKITLNAYITMKISFANTLAEMCERLEGGDVDAVTQAMGLDSRISGRYLKGALGYGGPCFPRDNRAFSRAASTLGVEAPLASMVDVVNRRQVERVLKFVEGLPGKKVVLGLTYKPGTDIIEESQAMEIAEKLGAKWYDPSDCPYTLEEVLKDAGVVVIATPWPEFEELRREDFPKDCFVVDCWRLLREEFEGNGKYIGLGLNRSRVAKDDEGPTNGVRGLL